jgi:hypothetical protein
VKPLTTFDDRDRVDARQVPKSYDGKRWHYGARSATRDRMVLMARASGYVMVRKPGCVPFVMGEKDWLSMPLWQDDAA